jgi:glycosyltransferase involved in cell wall biosynthesis
MTEQDIPKNSSKPRLLITTSTFPRWEADPGPAPFVFELAINLQKYFSVTVLAPHFPGAQRHEVWDGLEVIRFKYLPEKWQTLADGQGLQNHLRKGRKEQLKAVAFVIGEYLAGRKLLRDRQFDAVNSHWLVPSGLVFSRLCRSRKINHFVTVHAADYFMLNRITFGKQILNMIVGPAKALIPVNQKMADGIKAMSGQAKAFVMPMGFDPEVFKGVDEQELAALRKSFVIEGKRLILFVGKLTDKKGLLGLLDAVKILEKEISNFQLLIVGRGRLKPKLERRASKLQIMHRIKFAGSVPHNKVPLYYRLADVVVVPSLPDQYGESEGMPVVVLEALASRKPVVGTPYCSAPETLKQAGFMETEDASPEAIAKGLKKVLSGDFSADFSKVDQFSWPEVAKFYAGVISG